MPNPTPVKTTVKAKRYKVQLLRRSARRPAKIGRKNRAVNPMAVGISGGSNLPPPSECQTKYPADGYARQKTANGIVMSKTSPARFGFRNATMEAAMNTGPKSAPPNIGDPTEQPTWIVVAEWRPRHTESCKRKKTEQKAQREHEPTQYSPSHWSHWSQRAIPIVTVDYKPPTPYSQPIWLDTGRYLYDSRSSNRQQDYERETGF
jgi:hypothetical protein